MAKIAVFPGSFDPFTIGHLSIVERALPLFDKIAVALGENTTKKYMFAKENRMQQISNTFQSESKVEVLTYKGLTTELCQRLNVKFILRGLRNTIDYEYEKNIADMNYKMTGVETVFILSKPEHATISSTILREIHKNGGDISPFVPNSNLL